MFSWAVGGWSSLITVPINNSDLIRCFWLSWQRAPLHWLSSLLLHGLLTLAAIQSIVLSGWASHLNLPPLVSISISSLPLLHYTSPSSFSPSCQTLPSCFRATLQTRFHQPHAAFTCRCEIPMQLPILYSMSSSGEVTRALQGWQRTLLQNCILKSQSQHCQSRKVSGAAVCASLFLRESHSS